MTEHAIIAAEIAQADDPELAYIATYPRAFLLHAALGPARPRIVCLCGSTRFGAAFRDANLSETLAGRIVLSIGCDLKSDNELWSDQEEREAIKDRLDSLHRRKIDLADEVLVLNVDQYIGESTRLEVQYAESQDKPIRYLEPPAVS